MSILCGLFKDGDEDDDAEYDDEDEEVGIGWSQREKDGCKTVENNGRKRKKDGGMETVVYNSISKYMIPNRTLALTFF